MATKSTRVKSITVRFNKEVCPFQHIRVEITSTITKEETREEVIEELEEVAVQVFNDMNKKIYGIAEKPDDVPY